jgi:hypothetical protein
MFAFVLDMVDVWSQERMGWLRHTSQDGMRQILSETAQIFARCTRVT